MSSSFWLWILISTLSGGSQETQEQEKNESTKQQLRNQNVGHTQDRWKEERRKKRREEFGKWKESDRLLTHHNNCRNLYR